MFVIKEASKQELTEAERKKLDTFRSEYAATLAEYTLGNERAVHTLVMRQASTVERAVDALKRGYQRLIGRGDGYSRAECARIDKALRLYLKAAEAGGKFDLANKIRVYLKELEDEDEESVTPTDGFYDAENAAVSDSNDQKSGNMVVSGRDREYISAVEREDSEASAAEQKKSTGQERDGARSAQGRDNTKITVVDVETLRKIGRKSVNDFAERDIETSEKWARKFYEELGTKSPFFRAWFGDWRAHDKSKVAIVKIDRHGVISSGKTLNSDTGRSISWSKDAANESILNAPKGLKDEIRLISANISNLIENAVLLDTFVSQNDKKRKMPGTSWMHSFYSVVELDGKISVVKIFVEESYSEKQDLVFSRAYSLKYIEKVAEIDNGVHSLNRGLTDSHSTTINSISDLFEFVKRYDAEFKPKPVNRHLLNEDGTPRGFYHGTRENFTTFVLQDKPSFGRALGDGFYFTPSYDKAFKFANGLFSKGQDRGGIIMPVYLQMQNPYVIEKDADRSKWMSEYNAGNYDGIIDLKNDTYYVEGQAQIKSATDNIGTFSKFNPDIRYSIKPEKLSTKADNNGASGTVSDGGVDRGSKIGYNDLYTATDDFIRDVAVEDRAAFPRKLANKTSGIKPGEKRAVTIFGSANIYLFEATGYMQGRMLIKNYTYDTKYEKNRKDYYDEYKRTNNGRQGSNNILGGTSDTRGDSKGGVSPSDGKGKEGNVAIPYYVSRRNRARDTSRSDQNKERDRRRERELEKKVNALCDLYGLEHIFPDGESDGESPFTRDPSKKSGERSALSRKPTAPIAISSDNRIIL